ncbi:PH domain-containing protein [Annulohypoxylon truncatum]|uniref:PH domain-containing protein n=1 Tax=Annulohypoxylon truncatum TaxID=327061 RepID=UPI002007E48D|nr:PH domain-containing protein [Annulohypoxylon truncatum]KAI1213127.1 PH domain-containing protein [Annulohypoxylon truncatum]
MAETATQCLHEPSATNIPGRGATISIPSPSAMAAPANSQVSRLRNQFSLPSTSPVNQNGSFEFDRVLKSGYLQKRTQKTKAWKSVYLVLRPSALSIYKSDNESKLRHMIYTSELSAVTLLKDPKNKRHHLFGLFSPARNYHFEAPSLKDAQEWVDLIRKDARIEEEEEEMFLTSPVVRRQTFAPVSMQKGSSAMRSQLLDGERPLSSSPEPIDPTATRSIPSTGKRLSYHDYSGLSGNELASHSDMSDNEGQRIHGASIESLTARSPAASGTQIESGSNDRPMLGNRNASQLSGLNLESDPDRIAWQGWLWLLNSKRGVKQWKSRWAVLRPRNLILYKDESEYKASFILSLSVIVNVVDIDPVSKTKKHCFQIITDEKTYRCCARDEETLVHCLGAFKSLLAKRRELEARVAASGNVAAQTNQ